MGTKSVRKGLRQGDLDKDTYGRLLCTMCEESLKTKQNSDSLGSVRSCPECEEQWREIG